MFGFNYDFMKKAKLRDSKKDQWFLGAEVGRMYTSGHRGLLGQ